MACSTQPRMPRRREGRRSRSGACRGVACSTEFARTSRWEGEILRAVYALACSAAGMDCRQQGWTAGTPSTVSLLRQPAAGCCCRRPGSGESHIPHPSPARAHTHVPASHCACPASVKEHSLPLLQAAKESGDSYDPRGTGAAWTHNFLNSELSGICRRLLFSCTVLAGSVTDAS